MLTIICFKITVREGYNCLFSHCTSGDYISPLIVVIFLLISCTYLTLLVCEAQSSEPPVRLIITYRESRLTHSANLIGSSKPGLIQLNSQLLSITLSGQEFVHFQLTDVFIDFSCLSTQLHN